MHNKNVKQIKHRCQIIKNNNETKLFTDPSSQFYQTRVTSLGIVEGNVGPVLDTNVCLIKKKD